MTYRKLLGTLCVMAAMQLVAACQAQTQPAEQPQEGFALTIYSLADPATFDPKDLAQQRARNPYSAWQYKLPGYGVVREIRNIELAKGTNTIRFTDVAAGIDPTTVSFQSLTAPDAAAVLEQNYEYDLVNADKLLQKYLGKSVVVSRKSSPEQKSPADKIDAELLSFDPTNLVLQSGADGQTLIVPRNDLTEIRLSRLQTGLITKPTLLWKIESDQAGRHAAEVTYQTDSLTWRADYTFVVNQNDTATGIGAWVSILNESGISYPSAKLKLVAGDVQRVAPPQRGYENYSRLSSRAGDAGQPGFTEKAFFEYHLYTLGRQTTLPNNSTKQIELFPNRDNVPIKKTFVYYGLPAQYRYSITPQPNQDRNLGTESNKKVDIYLLLKNSQANGMGMPLPAGRIRVYKMDPADRAREFIGEDIIQHTPKDEQVMVKLGSAFDIVGERKQTDFQADHSAHWITESFEITLRNHKKEPVDVIIKENLFRWVNWEITGCSEKWVKQDYRTIHVPVQVPPDGEKNVIYTVRYT